MDEQRAYVSKPTTPALKRLKDAAQAVRLIIEKAAADIPRKAFKAVFSHILSIIVVRKKLFEPVSLEYLKALRASVAFQPHLDHLDIKLWTHAVSTCFSAVLGDDIRGYELVDDGAMDVDEEEDELATQSSSKKRKASAGLARSSAFNSDESFGSQRNGTYSAGQDIIELCGCIDALFKSPQAPLVLHGDALLSKFVRFFHAFPNETTAHLSAVTALNRLLSELEFNRKELLQRTVSHLWPSLVSLWSTKNIAIKEQLVVATTLLLPYAASGEADDGNMHTTNLYFATTADVENRWGADVLDLDTLALNCPITEREESHGFSTSLFQAGAAFDFQQALSWAVLHLSASCFLHSIRSSSSMGTQAPTPSRGPKRARVSSDTEIPHHHIAYRLYRQTLPFNLSINSCQI